MESGDRLTWAFRIQASDCCVLLPCIQPAAVRAATAATRYLMSRLCSFEVFSILTGDFPRDSNNSVTSNARMSGPKSSILFGYIEPDAQFQTIIENASGHVHPEHALRMGKSNILAMPTSTSPSLAAITTEITEKHLPKILNPTSEHRSLLRDHTNPLRVKLRNKPLVFVLEDGNFTLEGLLFAICIPIFGLEKDTSVAVREGTEGLPVRVGKWDIGSMVVVPGRHQLVYSAGEERRRCTFLFLPYIKEEVDAHH
ncbi:hypothetical protein BJX76DRAFT_127306 [Aspergillus varians]